MDAQIDRRVIKNNRIDLSNTIQEFEQDVLGTFPKMLAFKIKLLLTEMMSNAYKHGNQEDPEKIVVLSYHLSNMELEISVTDEGEGFALPPENDPVSFNTDESGRGLMIIREIADGFDLINNGRTLVARVKT